MADANEIAKGLLLIKATIDELLAKLEGEITFDADEAFRQKCLNIPKEFLDGP
jgi:hypothetical protein